jgi:hypothetical protein
MLWNKVLILTHYLSDSSSVLLDLYRDKYCHVCVFVPPNKFELTVFHLTLKSNGHLCTSKYATILNIKMAAIEILRWTLQ